ncbi:hypothetical protein CCACVL1_00203, partial [Corchorus capsularis]
MGAINLRNFSLDLLSLLQNELET